jgi:hypothetical protein
MSSNTTQAIQHYVIKFDNDLRQVGGHSGRVRQKFTMFFVWNFQIHSIQIKYSYMIKKVSTKVKTHIHTNT